MWRSEEHPWKSALSSKFSSVFSHSVVSDSLQNHGLQHARIPWPSLPPGVAQTQVHWVSDAIQPSHSVIPFSSCPYTFPVSGSFTMSQLFASGGQSIGESASAPLLSMNIQDCSPLELTGSILLLAKGLSKSSPAPKFESINSSALSLS